MIPRLPEESTDLKISGNSKPSIVNIRVTEKNFAETSGADTVFFVFGLHKHLVYCNLSGFIGKTGKSHSIADFTDCDNTHVSSSCDDTVNLFFFCDFKNLFIIDGVLIIYFVS